MAEVVVQEEAFEKAQDRAREERLRRAVEREMAAHRSLCLHYNRALERIAELEDREHDKIADLEARLAASEAERTRLQAEMNQSRKTQRKRAILFVCAAFAFLAFVVYDLKVLDLILSGAK